MAAREHTTRPLQYPGDIPTSPTLAALSRDRRAPGVRRGEESPSPMSAATPNPSLFPGLLLGPEGPYPHRVQAMMSTSDHQRLHGLAQQLGGRRLSEVARVCLHVALAAVDAVGFSAFLMGVERAMTENVTRRFPDPTYSPLSMPARRRNDSAHNGVTEDGRSGTRPAHAHPRITSTTTDASRSGQSLLKSTTRAGRRPSAADLEPRVRALGDRLLAAWREATGRLLPVGDGYARALARACAHVEEHGLEDACAGLRFAVAHPASGSPHLACSWFADPARFAGWVERGRQLAAACAGSPDPDGVHRVALAWASAGVRAHREDASTKRRWTDLREEGLALVAAEIAAGTSADALCSAILESECGVWTKGAAALVARMRARRCADDQAHRQAEERAREEAEMQRRIEEREAFLAAQEVERVRRAEREARAAMSENGFLRGRIEGKTFDEAPLLRDRVYAMLAKTQEEAGLFDAPPTPTPSAPAAPIAPLPATTPGEHEARREAFLATVDPATLARAEREARAAFEARGGFMARRIREQTFGSCGALRNHVYGVLANAGARS